jgi:quercetin dioxygenase-like cupin family protein
MMMRLKPYLVGMALLASVLLDYTPAWGAERLFVLKGKSQILQYKIDNEGIATLTRSYSDKDFPKVFPASRMEMRSGNILYTFDQQVTSQCPLFFDTAADSLKIFQGDPGEPADRGGRILENPALEEPFRGDQSLYGKTRGGRSYRDIAVVQEAYKATGGKYRDIFVLEGQVFGLREDRIERLSGKDGSRLTSTPETVLVLPGSRLIAAALSPWGEIFIADTGKNSIQRVSLRGGTLVSNDPITDKTLISPQGLEFSPDGELFLANNSEGPSGVLRFKFVLDDFVQWRAVPSGSLDLEGAGALDLALARPVGFVISEKVQPLVKLSAKEAGGHYGIAQALFVSPQLNSESSVIALVQYDPGGHTPVHLHPKMEQVEVVLSGKALWEVGEFEKEVGPGDVIFCPRNVKHGYKVLGNTPFKFLQLEWREWTIRK